MTKAKIFLGIWIILISLVAGAFYYTTTKDKTVEFKPEKTQKKEQIKISDIGGWFKGFAENNKTIYPATEFLITTAIGDKKEEPFYSITLSGLSESDIGGVERKLANMGLLYVSDFDGVKFSFLILFEDKNAMMLSYEELKKIYPFAKQGTMPIRSSNL